MKYEFEVWRDGNERFRLRKVNIRLSVNGNFTDHARMFAGPFFERRLARKIKRMKKRADIMEKYSSFAKEKEKV